MPTQIAAPLPEDLTLVALVSKQQALPSTYAPTDLMAIPAVNVSSLATQRLRRPAAEALARMLTAAQKEGFGLKVNSGYRSYEDQLTTFRSQVRQLGCVKALRESAVPGHSEHQLGLAVDITSAGVAWDLDEAFGNLPEGKWLAANAPSFGFVLSYPEGREAITGYSYEPWHFRYVSVPMAEAIKNSGMSPTEYLKLIGKANSTISAPVPPDREPGQSSCGL